MKTALGILGAILAFLLIFAVGFVLFGFNMYRSIYASNEDVNQSWGQVQNVYQRRADLIPNLVETVKAAGVHEHSTFTEVAAARASAGKVSASLPSGQAPTKEQIEQFAQTQQGLGTAISRLMMIQEQYPQLQANANYRDLMAQLEGTENRISVERMRYNEAVTVLNKKLKVPPSSWIASLTDVTPRDNFKAEAGSEKAPKVNFGTK